MSWGTCCYDRAITKYNKHAIKQHHCIDWENAKIVDHQQELHKRCYSESWQIRMSGPSMNRDTGLLPTVYNCLTKM